MFQAGPEPAVGGATCTVVLERHTQGGQTGRAFRTFEPLPVASKSEELLVISCLRMGTDPFPGHCFHVFLGFPVSKSKCSDGSQDSKLPLHASHVDLPT